MNFFQTLGLDPATIRAKAAAMAMPAAAAPAAAAPAAAAPPMPVNPMGNAPQNMLAARSGIQMPQAPANSQALSIASRLMPHFGGMVPQMQPPTPTPQPIMQAPMQGAPAGMPQPGAVSNALPAPAMQQNFLRQRLGLF